MAKISPFSVWSLLRELQRGAGDERPLVVSGPLAEQLAKELGRGADPRWVRVDGSTADAVALVRVLGGAVTEEDERVLRAANRAGTPVVAVQTAPELHEVPYVLATDVVACAPGSGFPVEELAAVLAAKLGEDATALAAHVPVLRETVVEGLIERFSRRNAVIGAAVFIPGADFAVLTLNQLRLVLRMAIAYGVEVDQQRLPEVVATVVAGLGFRGLARRLLGVIPIAGWVIKGGVAYVGTRALGEAAKRYFQEVSESPTAA
jgi:uncharacterized protein (DUF697 family)